MSILNPAERARQKFDSLVTKLNQPNPNFAELGENFSSSESQAALQLPDNLLASLREHNLTLYLALTPDGQVILSVADAQIENSQLLAAIDEQKGFKTRGKYYETWYLGLYGEAQRNSWKGCDDIYQIALKTLAVLAKHKVVSLPDSLLEAQKQIEESGDHINTIEKAEALLVGIWDLFRVNKYSGKIQKLTTLGFTPQNMRGSMAAMNFD